MSCEYCKKLQVRMDGAAPCCWAVAMEIKSFKKRVFQFYILECLFDMVCSIASVVIDIITVSHYFSKGKWVLAVLTGLPVLLPTIVFTNVYLSDESRGYCKLPKDRLKRRKKAEEEKESGEFLNRIEERIQMSSMGMGFYNCIAFIGGILHSIFHKDRRIRQRGAKLARKSLRRSAKYFFGTLVLRFIAWTWYTMSKYLKAFIYGVKAFKQPQKYMKIEEPIEHWSKELLIRLDFFQAALENAPQCVIQLFALLTQPEEDVVLGFMALCFSFIDFIRVSTTVLWNINRGPVVAPKGCYGTLIWNLMNISSWVFLYTARCAAISLIVGTSVSSDKFAILTVPLIAAVIHCGLIGFMVARLKAGQASQKLAVTTFISIFFLPDLDSLNVHMIVQFYYALTLTENFAFVIPWGGDISFKGFCWVSKNLTDISKSLIIEPTTAMVSLFSGNFEKNSECLIDPVYIVLIVPSLTIIGIVFRLAASQKMTQFKSNQPSSEENENFIMEERVANIYSRQWTKMSAKEMWAAFIKMLRKEVAPKTKIQNDPSKTDARLSIIDNFDKGETMKTAVDKIEKSQSQFDPGQRSQDIFWDFEIDTETLTAEDRKQSNHFETIHSRRLQRSKSQSSFQNFRKNLFFQHLDVRFLKVESENGVQVFETIHI